MFSWLRRGRSAPGPTWNVAASPDHTYVVFGDAKLSSYVPSALAAVDTDLAERSHALRAAERDPIIADEFDEAGKVRNYLAAHVTTETVDDIAAARDATAEPAAFAAATHGVRVRASGPDTVDMNAPYALLGAAAAIARSSGGRAYDTIGRRVLSQETIEDPFAGLATRSVGPHVAIVAATQPDGSLRFKTLGYEKYGLFDVTLAAPASQPRATEIVAGFTQAFLAEAPVYAGPFAPDVCYVEVEDVANFANVRDASELNVAKPTYFGFRVQPISGESRIWAMSGDKRALDADAVNDILRAFDRDRASAVTRRT